MTVEDEVGAVVRDRLGEATRAEEGEDARRLALEGRGRRRVVKQGNAQVAARDPREAALERLDLSPALRVHLAQERLAEVRQERSLEAADEALGPGDPDLDPAHATGCRLALEQSDPALGEHHAEL